MVNILQDTVVPREFHVTICRKSFCAILDLPESIGEGYLIFAYICTFLVSSYLTNSGSLGSCTAD